MSAKSGEVAIGATSEGCLCFPYSGTYFFEGPLLQFGMALFALLPESYFWWPLTRIKPKPLDAPVLLILMASVLPPILWPLTLVGHCCFPAGPAHVPVARKKLQQPPYG